MLLSPGICIGNAQPAAPSALIQDQFKTNFLLQSGTSSTCICFAQIETNQATDKHSITQPSHHHRHGHS